MAPIPFVLFFWGPKIRARSRVARMLKKEAEQQRIEMEKNDMERQKLNGGFADSRRKV